MGKQWKQKHIFFSWAPESLQMVTAAMKLKDTPWKESDGKPRQCVKKQRRHFADKGPYSQRYGFSSSHVWMWELDHKENWAPKNCCFDQLEKTPESPLDCKEIKPVHPKGNQPWIFIGRAVAEDEAPILWPPDVKSWLIGEDLEVGKDWRQEEKGMARGWDGWMTSPTQWTWIWAGSGSWWWTGKPGMLQSIGSKRVRHDWATELNWTVLN